MATYLYQNPETKEVKEIFQSMQEKHTYSENGVEWNRIFTVPQSSIDTRIDPWSAKDFVEKTGKKSGTLGGLWDKSRELSEKRKGSSNFDPIKDKHYESYKQKVGKDHIDVLRSRSKKKLDSMNVVVE